MMFNSKRRFGFNHSARPSTITRMILFEACGKKKDVKQGLGWEFYFLRKVARNECGPPPKFVSRLSYGE